MAREEALAERNGSAALETLMPLQISYNQPEYWYAHYWKNQLVGYSHLRVEEKGKGASALLHYNLVTEYYEPGEEGFVRTKFELRSLETNKGVVREYSGTQTKDGIVTTVSGKVGKNKLQLTVTNEGKTEQADLPWDSDTLGPFALEQQLIETSKSSDETFEKQLKFKAISVNHPLLLPAEWELEYTGKSAIPFAEGETTILREYEVRALLPESKEPIRWYVYCNESGDILRRYLPQTDLRMEKSDKSIVDKLQEPNIGQPITPKPALADNEALELGDFQLAAAPLVKSVDDIVEYVLTGFVVSTTQEVDLQSSFAEVPWQTFPGSQPKELKYVIARPGIELPESVKRELPKLEPSSGDSASNPWIQSDAPEIQKLATSITAGTDDLPTLFASLATAVKSTITTPESSPRFVSAQVAATSGTGDSTERALLLTALCRAKGIPARVVAGVCYADDGTGPRMQYKMWTLAYANSQWHHLDAESAEGTAPADRIGLAMDDLAGGNVKMVTADVANFIAAIQVTVKGGRRK